MRRRNHARLCSGPFDSGRGLNLLMSTPYFPTRRPKQQPKSVNCLDSLYPFRFYGCLPGVQGVVGAEDGVIDASERASQVRRPAGAGTGKGSPAGLGTEQGALWSRDRTRLGGRGWYDMQPLGRAVERCHPHCAVSILEKPLKRPLKRRHIPSLPVGRRTEGPDLRRRSTPLVSILPSATPRSPSRVRTSVRLSPRLSDTGGRPVPGRRSLSSGPGTATPTTTKTEHEPPETTRNRNPDRRTRSESQRLDGTGRGRRSSSHVGSSVETRTRTHTSTGAGVVP